MTDEDYMRLALKEAEFAAEANEVPIGAVLVRNGEILVRSRNAVEQRKSGIAHAELLAIEEAMRRLGEWRLEGCTLYVTKEPCAMCAGAMVNCRLSRVVFGCPDLRCGAAGGFLNVCDIPGAMQKVVVTSCILEQDCRDILQRFFRERRSGLRAKGNPLF